MGREAGLRRVGTGADVWELKLLELLCPWCEVRMGLSPARRGEGWGEAGGRVAVSCGWAPLLSSFRL